MAVCGIRGSFRHEKRGFAEKVTGYTRGRADTQARPFEDGGLRPTYLTQVPHFEVEFATTSKRADATTLLPSYTLNS